MSPPPDAGAAWAARMLRSSLGLAAWTALWTASLALAAFGPGALWGDEPVLSAVAISASVLLGVGMLLAYRRNLRSMDELQRTTQLEAMAWSLGAGLVGGLAWTLATRHVLVGFDAEIAHLVVFMALVYVAGCLVGALRYR